jgi:hypothetical protein
MTFEDFVDNWLGLWPEGVISGGKYLKSSKKDIAAKLKKFIKDYPEFTTDTIFNATGEYLAAKETQDWAYTRCATYFIHKKGEGSDLAACCSAYEYKWSRLNTMKDNYVRSSDI